LKSERELLKTIIDRAPVMITVFNPETRTLQLNRQFVQFLGWAEEPVTPDYLMQHSFPDEEYRRKVAAFIEACGPDWMDITMQTRTGRPIETSWANYQLSDGTRVGIGIEITDRKRLEAQQALLLGETSHRLRNLFAVASSVIDMSASNAHTPGEMAEAVHDRLQALTRAHALMQPQAHPAGQETSLRALLAAIFAPYAPADGIAPFTWNGSDLPLGPDALSGLALLLHEFATNAAKHGALSRAGGGVAIESVAGAAELAFTWRESGGPSIAGAPGARGFGAYLADRVVNGQFNGRMTREWSASGLTIRLWLPLERLRPFVSPPLVDGAPRK
jgi:PAS domain S-box-containing protein